MDTEQGNMLLERIEDLLEKQYWVVDMLPCRVPEKNEGQFFAVEQHYLNGARYKELRLKMADVLLKLNCYYAFEVCVDAGEVCFTNPNPKALEKLLLRKNGMLNILLKTADALISVNGDDTHMTFYNPSPELISLIGRLASANGLFVWQP